MNGINRLDSGGNAPGGMGGAQEPKPAPIKTQAEFKELMNKMEADKAAGKEPEKEDMQALLRYSIRQSVQQTGRQIQQAAKDIERENLDKGF